MTWRIINSLVLLAALWYLLKKPIATFFKERKAQIAKDLEDAKLQREKAERTLKDYEAKMAGMEQEIERLKAELKKSAAAEGEKVVANADRMAATMVESAKLAAEQEVRKAKAELQAESVDLAVEMAEALIREKIGDDDQKKIIEEYLSKVGGMK
jgi:F-type H+-transporting ATPase subunit b